MSTPFVIIVVVFDVSVNSDSKDKSRLINNDDWQIEKILTSYTARESSPFLPLSIINNMVHVLM